MIRADPDPLADLADPPHATAPARPAGGARAKQNSPNPLAQHPFPSPSAPPAWARASGRADGDPMFAAGACLAPLDSFLRRDPPAAGALRQRLALQSATVSAKLLRLNADAAAFRDLRFAVGDALGPAAKLLKL